MFGAGRDGRIRKATLISLTSEERRARPHMGSRVFAEDIANDFISHGFRGSKKQVIHDGVLTVAHREGVRNEAESRNLLQAVAEGGDNFLIPLLDDCRAE